MTLHTKHKFVSAKTPSGDTSLVRPNNWNDDHDIKSDITTGIVLGRSSGSVADDIVELPFDISSTGRVQVKGTDGIAVPSGATTNRPATPRNGEMRFNTDTGNLEVYGLGNVAAWTLIGQGAFSPPGTVIAYAGDTAPTGWLVCNGQSLVRTTYPQLFGAIGTKYGSSSASTFNVPNYVNRVLVGAGSNYTVGQEKGAFLQTVPLPAHQHELLFSDGSSGNMPATFDSGGGVTGSGAALLNAAKSLVGTDIKGTAGVQMSVEQPGTGIFWLIRGG